VADSVGLSVEQVSVTGGDDSAISPYGGGAWASRGTAIGGEAALRAGIMLKRNILALASAITQTPADALTIAVGEVINTRTGQAVISLADVGRIGYFRQDTLPADFDVQLSVSASFGSVWVAVNDALKPLGAKIRHQPFTPERILDALVRET
jgi:carbon-monoxide dehydrogenase large subunit